MIDLFVVIRHSIYSFWVLCLVSPLASAQEPFWIQSHQLQPFLTDSYVEFERNAIERFGFDDDISKKLMKHIDAGESHLQDRFRKRFGVSSWALMLFRAPNGTYAKVNAFKVDSSESLAAKRDEYVERIGEGASVQVDDGVTIVEGTSGVSMENGREVKRGWVPMMLKLQGNVLYTSSDPYFQVLCKKNNFPKLPNELGDTDWYYESHPTAISENERNAALGSAFANIGVSKQQRDAESDDAYTRRVATVELWEQYLRSWYFETEKIVCWSSRKRVGKPVRYRLELTAEKNSQLAKLFNDLRYQRSTAVLTEGLFSGSAAISIDKPFGQRLSGAIRQYFGESGVGVLSAVCSSLESGHFVADWVLNKGDDSTLVALISMVVETAERSSLLANKETADSVVGVPAMLREVFGTTRTEISSTDDDRLLIRWLPQNQTQSKELASEERTAAIFAARANLHQLVDSPPDSPARKLLNHLCDAYLRYKMKNSRERVDLRIFGGAKIVEKFRDKIIAGDSKGWEASLAVNLVDRERKLVVDLKLGTQLAGFLPIAETYWGHILYDLTRLPSEY